MAGSSSSDDGEISGINVTPLVDVMLVLLVIFMTTTTLIEHEAIPVVLPKAANGGPTESKTLAIAIQQSGNVFVDGVAMPAGKAGDDALLAKVAATDQAKAGKLENLQAMISADDKSFHGSVIHVLDVLKQGGISKFAFEIQPAQ